MLAQLYLRRKPTFWPGGLSVPTPPPIELDVSIREQHGHAWRWTEAPIEGGERVTDHGIELPTSLRMEIGMSSHPDEIVPNVVSTRHIRLYQQIVALARRKEPFDVVTSLAIYTSMVFDRISAPRTRESTNAIIVSCTLHKVEIATVDVAQNLADAAQEIALGEQDIGAVAAAAEAAA